MRVHAVEVGAVVVAAEEDVVIKLKDRAGALSAADVHHIVAAGRPAELASLENQFAALANADTPHMLAVFQRGKNAVTHGE